MKIPSRKRSPAALSHLLPALLLAIIIAASSLPESVFAAPKEKDETPVQESDAPAGDDTATDPGVSPDPEAAPARKNTQPEEEDKAKKKEEPEEELPPEEEVYGPQLPETMLLSGGGEGEGGVPDRIEVAPTDPKNFLQGFHGDFQADLFTGSATYTHPLWIPNGRNGMQPNLALSYSSSDQNINSIVGYGWSLPMNSVYRCTAKGLDQLYAENDFCASVFGSTEELVLTDAANHIYMPKTSGGFTKYQYNPAAESWTATDTRGVQYSFGATAALRHADPNDSDRIYKWLLEKVQDPNGNFMKFTYYQDSGQVYPDTIRYTGFDSDPGNYELVFQREARSKAPRSYVTGFGVTTAYRIDEIQIRSYHTGSAQTVRSYLLDYNDTGTAVEPLASITAQGGSLTMPPVSFDYYDGTDGVVANVAVQKIHLLKKITLPTGGATELVYKPSTAYRTAAQGITNTSLPFLVHTLHQATTTDPVTGLTAVTTYEYEGGHYFFDQQDAYTREYAGFATVKATDPAGNITVTRFHQSQFARDNAASAALGEYDDHIAKKGRIWRQESYDDQGVLYGISISTWDKTQLSDDDPDHDRFFPRLAKEVAIAFDAQATGRASAAEYAYDTANGNLTQQADFGEVTLTDDDIDQNNKYDGDGAYTDSGTDKITTTIEYAQNTSAYILSYPKRTEKKNQADVVTSDQKIYYDDLAFGEINKGNATKAEVLITSTPAQQYAVSQASYNSYGLPTSFTNPRNYQTTITYDSLNLFPATVTNAKQQTTAYTYDARFGSPIETEDPNGLIIDTLLDDLGRPTETKVSDPAAPTQLKTTATNSYDLTNQPVSMTAVSKPDNTDVDSNPIEITSKTYLDGFGRQIQTRAEWEGSNTYLVTGTVYDSKGNVKKGIFD